MKQMTSVVFLFHIKKLPLGSFSAVKIVETLYEALGAPCLFLKHFLKSGWLRMH